MRDRHATLAIVFLIGLLLLLNSCATARPTRGATAISAITIVPSATIVPTFQLSLTPTVAATQVLSPTLTFVTPTLTIITPTLALISPTLTIVIPTLTLQPSATRTAVPLPPNPLPVSPTDTSILSRTEPITPNTEPQSYHYVFPVQGAKVSYSKYHHDYPATDIFCPIGSLFVAPTDGVIDWVSHEDTWDPKTDEPAVRGGLSVALIGDDGVRYYGSHLSEVDAAIAPGVRVSAGQTLGKTGKSGDARYTDSHLHFGISHPTTPDDWEVRRGEISPYPYLQAWEQGESMTPQVLP